MEKYWQRHRHIVRRTLLWSGAFFVVYLFVAVAFGVDGAGTLSAATATRGFFGFVPGVARTLFFGSGGTPFPGLWLVLVNMVLGMAPFIGIFWFMSRGRTYTMLPGNYDVTFDDVRGQPHIVGATKEVMTLFQGFKEFKKIGGYPPHGILLEGPPGTGKTLLAKAIAGETGVPFVYASGASFAAMFLGVPQMRIARMFAKARRYSERYGGCVIFLDELDAVAESRNGVSGGGGMLGGLIGGGGASSTVNELLTQMDGIDKPKRLQGWVRRMLHQPPVKSARHNILVVGATNRAAALDAALLRPGRFDRKIHVPNPGEEGRKDIIAYYLNKVAHAPIDIDRLARATNGYSPAQIKSLINEALIFALREGRQALTFDDIWKAKLTDEIGLAEPVEYTPKDKAVTGIHEAGHAIAGHFLRPEFPVQVVSIRKRGGAGGVTAFQAEEETHYQSKSQMLANIKVALAGMVAEEMWMGESSGGPAGDLAGATGMAFQMVTRFGLGSQLTSLALLDGNNFEGDLATALRDDNIRREIDGILQQCKRDVAQLLEQQRTAMEAVRDALVERGEITGDEFRTILWELGAVAERPRALPVLRVQNGNGHNGHGADTIGFPGIPAGGSVAGGGQHRRDATHVQNPFGFGGDE